MRIAALVALSLLVAGCSHPVGDRSGQPQTSVPTSPTRASASGTASKPATPSAAPAAGAPISDVIAWIEAGHSVDPGGYHSASRAGISTQLGTDIAFVLPSGQSDTGRPVTCMTDSKHTDGTLSCLISLNSPPPKPETAYGDWKSGWVDFDGIILQVGSVRADPGPFLYGDGSQLAAGDSLAFGDYRCRADRAGVFCVNYAHQSAARFSSAGIEPFGCLRSVPPPDGVGIAFSC
ncbi:hypothetical protein A5791_02705 [Mycobacterium sp. 852002-51163_SCH5372311]|uniref:hypothetical protein n=1 Tax=Mycobacterium sp. 852002-51163_SCH5372311 TaxID=1834097 RepID=UPI000800396F|nr:hypothetical protein [Mycobacterium sp. 852002-51163_SCH5372311]OBF83741.1 hypothetical protein A5791_02705 [Mycobacterium sp. 852002-51163_SCH5372311]